MDKSWMTIVDTTCEAYENGVDAFLDFAFANTSDKEIPCPCIDCNNCFIKSRDEVKVDLMLRGIVESYTQWNYHGEEYRPRFVPMMVDNATLNQENDDMHELIRDAIGLNTNTWGNEESAADHAPEEPNEAARKFLALLSDAEKELYPGCKKFSRLSFVVKLLHIKCLTGMSNKAVTMLLELLNEAFPDDVSLPKSHYAAKKMTRDLGLKYVKIDACRNDCILYWKKYSKREKCPHCKEPRWKSDSTSVGNEDANVSTKRKKVAVKILRYFPLKPRLQRLFISKKIASDMRWHHTDRVDDGVMRHPADSLAWKNFDKIHESFALEPGNVRLGLASDGMNPFGNMSISHSTWPVVIVPYNLPPWMCMKRPFFMLSLLIPGPKAPGNDIDVYMRPLIDELKELWNEGVMTYDASREINFQLRAAMLWTINDFPAYANLSGWSTKGELACPCCKKETSSYRLKNGRKFAYMGHRRFLPRDHKWRFQKSTFNGMKEERPPPKRLSTKDIIDQINGYAQVTFGKHGKKRKHNEITECANWKKKTIFAELPYYDTLELPHCLDLMHIEKNVLEIVLGTTMNVEGKTKDNLKARLDLMAMGIRKDLHPYQKGDKFGIPTACFTFSKDEKQSICDSWKRLKVSDGYSSNISRCVNPKERKIYGLKSHDCHVILQQFLPIAIRDGMLTKDVRDVLIEISAFFRVLCSKTLKVSDLDKLDIQIVETLCKLERIFPPSFFVVMMHLPVHLPSEAKLGGPVQYRWMYPIERFLHFLKAYVRNRAYPEGSIAEGYIAEECLTFCSHYLSGIETRFNRSNRNDDSNVMQPKGEFSIFTQTGCGLRNPHGRHLSEEEWLQARLYVLQNCEEIQPFIDEHKEELKRISDSDIDIRHNEEFPDWFRTRVMSLKKEGSDKVTEDLLSLAEFPAKEVACYNGLKINGFRFRTKGSEQNMKSQNSGVMVKGDDLLDDMAYYGVLHDVVELKYILGRRVFLFKCHWWDVIHKGSGYKRDAYQYISLNSMQSIYADQPFVLASQAEQAFYVQEIKNSDWLAVVNTQPRDTYNIPEKENREIIDEGEDRSSREAYQENEVVDLLAFVTRHDNDNNDGVAWKRNDISEEEDMLVDAEEILQPEMNVADDADIIDDDDDDDDVDDGYDDEDY